MQQEYKYESIEKINTYEFGFIHYFVDKQIEIIVIDELTNYIRSLGHCMTIDDALFILETSIKYGFNEKGLKFIGIPNYQLSSKFTSNKL